MSVVDHLQTLVRFQTVSGKEQQQEVEKLYEWFIHATKNPYFTSQVVRHNGFASLLVLPKRKAQNSIILSAHIDVLPGTKEQFVPTIKHDRLYARGASDMKFAAACYVELLQTNPEKLAQKGISIILTSDEELAGMNGVKWLKDTGRFETKLVILPDGGNNLAVIKAAKGMVWAKVTYQGKSTHASKPWEGENACDALLALYSTWLQEFQPATHANQWVDTISLTKMEGGSALNQVPHSASLYFDIRFTEKNSVKKFQTALKRAFPRCTIEILIGAEAFTLPTKHNMVQKFGTIVQKHTGKKMRYMYDNGTSDARFLVASGIPVIMTKPESGGHHAEDEWIDLKSLEQYFAILTDFLLS